MGASLWIVWAVIGIIGGLCRRFVLWLWACLEVWMATGTEQCQIMPNLIAILYIVEFCFNFVG